MTVDPYEVLRSLEWIGAGGDECPICGELRARSRHADGCQMGAALAEAGPLLWDVTKVAAAVDCSRSYLFEMVRAGTFPAPVKMGRLSRWRPETVVSWVQGRPGGGDENGMVSTGRIVAAESEDQEGGA